MRLCILVLIGWRVHLDEWGGRVTEVYKGVAKPVVRLLLLLARGPVPRDRAERMAGYTRAGLVKRALEAGLVEERDGMLYLTREGRRELTVACTLLKMLLDECYGVVMDESGND